MQTNDISGLSKILLDYIDITSLKFGSECLCDIIIKESSLAKCTGAYDDGLLIALIDTFSSYCLMFLLPNENYQHYLSVNITMVSYEEIKPVMNSMNQQTLNIKVLLSKEWGRNVLLDIRVYYEGREMKKISHLKRKISAKL